MNGMRGIEFRFEWLAKCFVPPLQGGGGLVVGHLYLGFRSAPPQAITLRAFSPPLLRTERLLEGIGDGRPA